MKIIHTSDIHLASPLTSKLSGVKAKKRAAELREIFSRICMGAEASGVSAVIIAGDLFDTERITKSDIDSALSAIEAAKDITFFYLCGNHEGSALQNSGVRLPENLKLFGEGWTYYRLGD